MSFLIPVLVLVAAYLIGGIPFGYLVVKWTTGADVRSSGSGNIGATNVLRTTGRAAGIATLLLDIGKGYLAVWVAGRESTGDPLVMSAAALTVMAGHAYPVFLNFRGGKAVASYVGAFLCLSPWAVAAEIPVFVGILVWTRQVSLASIIGAATFPLAIWLVVKSPWSVLAASMIAGTFIIYKHRSNIARIREGSENLLRF